MRSHKIFIMAALAVLFYTLYKNFEVSEESLKKAKKAKNKLHDLFLQFEKVVDNKSINSKQLQTNLKKKIAEIKEVLYKISESDTSEKIKNNTVKILDRIKEAYLHLAPNDDQYSKLDYEKMTVKDLLILAKSRKIEIKPDATKSEIIAQLLN